MKLNIERNSVGGKQAFSIVSTDGVRRGTITWLLGGDIPPAFQVMPQQYGWTKRKLAEYCRNNGLSVYWF